MENQKFGRIVIDQDGISQKPILGFFGKRFSLRWGEIRSWNVQDAVLFDVAARTERVVSHLVSLYWDGGVHIVVRSARDVQFQAIVALLRENLPGKETRPRPGYHSLPTP